MGCLAFRSLATSFLGLVWVAPAAQPERSGGDHELVARARLVDERGAAVAHGTLSVRLVDERRVADDRGAVAEAGADGEVVLAFDRRRVHFTGIAVFTASAPGRATLQRQLDLPAAEESSCSLGDLVLVPGGACAGRVVDSGGAPVAGAFVQAGVPQPETEAERAEARLRVPLRLVEGMQRRATSAADGRYRLEGLPCTQLELFAGDGERLVARSTSVEVRAGESTLVTDLVLEVPAEDERIEGRVVSGDGKPLPGISVDLGGPGEGGLYTSRPTGPDGRFRFLAARGTVYRLYASDVFGRARAESEPVRGGELVLELRFGERRWMELVVRDAEGPVDGFWMRVESADEPSLGSVVLGSVAFLPVPGEAFHLWFFTPMHRERRYGPFEAATAPERLEVELERSAPAGESPR